MLKLQFCHYLSWIETITETSKTTMLALETPTTLLCPSINVFIRQYFKKSLPQVFPKRFWLFVTTPPFKGHGCPTKQGKALNFFF